MGITRLGTRSSPLGQAGLVVAAFCLALPFGLASVFLSAWFVVSPLVMPAVLTLPLLRPEYALPALNALVYGLLRSGFVPPVPFLGGSFEPANATLVVLTVGAVWMFAARKGKADSLPVAGARWLAISLGPIGPGLRAAMPVSLWYRNLGSTLVLGAKRDFIPSKHK